MRRRFAIAVALVVGGALLWWAVHPRPSDRELIEQLIAKAVHGVETNSAQEIMECVAPDYQDGMGFTRTDIWRIATHWARSPNTADISIDNYVVEVNSPRATGRFDVRVVLTQDGQHVDLDFLQVTVEFEKQQRRWRKVWLVTSVTGAGIGRLFEEYM